MSRLTFEEVYHDWSSYVYSLSYRLAGNKNDAEDLAQESFVRVFRFLKDYRGGSIKGWLYKIVTNTFYLKIEKDKKGPVLPGDDRLIERISSQSEPNMLEVMQRAELGTKVHEAIASLPADYRVTVILADLEEMNYQEIADVLGIPIGTVRSRISRGRNILKEILSDERSKL